MEQEVQEHEPDRRLPKTMEPDERTDDQPAESPGEASPLLQELVAYLREQPHGSPRGMGAPHQRRRASGRDVGGGDLLEATEVFDNDVDALETGSIETCRRTPASSPSESSPAASRRTRRSASCRCCASARAPPVRQDQEDQELLHSILDATSRGQLDRGDARVSSAMGARRATRDSRSHGASFHGAAAPRTAAQPADHRRVELSCPASSPNSSSARSVRTAPGWCSSTSPGPRHTLLWRPSSPDGRGRLMGASTILTGCRGDRPDARGPRRRPRHHQDGRRPPGRPRGGRAAGRLPRSVPGRRDPRRRPP